MSLANTYINACVILSYGLRMRRTATVALVIIFVAGSCITPIEWYI